MKDQQADSMQSFMSDRAQTSLFGKFEVTIFLKECPFGFYFDEERKLCSCQKDVVNNKIECDLMSFKILRPSPKWINATFIHTTTSMTSGVIVHKHCPFDYCRLTKGELLPLDLEAPDEQCAFNRLGILCGECQAHFSHVLGM